jgi:hypothetical protein
MAAPEAMLLLSLCDADSPSLTCSILDGMLWLAASGPEGMAEGVVASLGMGVARAWNM